MKAHPADVQWRLYQNNQHIKIPLLKARPGEGQWESDFKGMAYYRGGKSKGKSQFC